MCTPGTPIGPIAIQIHLGSSVDNLPEVLRRVVRRAVVLLELGVFVRGAPFNVQAELAVEVLQLQRAREVALFGPPDHAAGILVLARPLLNNRPIAPCAVPDVHTQATRCRRVGRQVCVLDEEALGAEVDAPPTPPRGTFVGEHIAERHELVGPQACTLLVASALLDGQAGPVVVAVLWGSQETLVAPDIDQLDERERFGAVGPGRRWRYAGVSTRWQRRRDQDHRRCR